MKSLMSLWRETANELAVWCCTSTALDYKTVKSRVEHEGLSFLTISLPAFGKDFERSLDEGQVGLNAFLGFKRKGGLPLFLGGFLDRVFDRGTGRLLDDPCIDSIFAIRQLTLMFGKILIPCSDARTEDAMRKYIQCEQEVRRVSGMSRETASSFARLTSLVFGQAFSDIDKLVYEGNILPKHGPGATADYVRGNAKYDQSEWTERLERIFPFTEYAVPSLRYHYLSDSVDFLEPGRERPVRVISVPKTLKTPRIIAIEPTCMQYMQQALASLIVGRIESDSLLSRFIGFSDQSVNRQMAEDGSRKGTLATLDLSEASDRVSNQHVRELFSRFPHLLQGIDATRSRKADVLGKTIRLAKFASMGSALCFPVEAMIFLIISLIGIEKSLSRQLTYQDLKDLVGQVRVYGDDIIVPVDSVRSVISELEDFGLRVNTGKSFWTGKFRESCGGDYYDGQVVTPVRVRRVFPSSRRDAQELISLVSLRNQLYHVGLWQTCRWLDEKIEEILPHFPVVPSSSAALGRHSLFPPKGTKRDRDTQQLLVRAYVPHSKLPASEASGEGSLLKCLLSLEQRNSDEPVADSGHLERSGRPESVSIKLRWVPALSEQVGSF